MQVPNNSPTLTNRSVARETHFTPGVRNPSLAAFGGRVPRYQTLPAPKRGIATIIPIPAEPDDAHLTGATRSLSRRLLALNIRQDA